MDTDGADNDGLFSSLAGKQRTTQTWIQDSLIQDHEQDQDLLIQDQDQDQTQQFQDQDQDFDVQDQDRDSRLTRPILEVHD